MTLNKKTKEIPLWDFLSQAPVGEIDMKRQKPDLIWVLVLVLGLGVAFSSVGGDKPIDQPSPIVSSNP